VASALSPQRVEAQPTWSFDIKPYPADLYPGEWGEVTLNITNMDCETRIKYYTYEFDDLHEDELEEILRRAEELKASGQISDLNLTIKSSHGVGGNIYHDGELTLWDVCTGRSITIRKSYLWFPFKEVAETYIFENGTEVELEAFNRDKIHPRGLTPQVERHYKI